MRIDVVTGPEVPPYTAGLLERLRRIADIAVLQSKSYARDPVAQLFALWDHPAVVRRRVRERAVLHVDSQRLAYVIARRLPVPSVVTCNDVLGLTHMYADPSYEPRSRLVRQLRQWGIRRGLAVADRVVCPSDFTRRALVELVPEAADRIRLVPWAVDTDRFRPEDRDACRQSLGLPSGLPLILVVGTESPRKNMDTTVRVLARVRSSIPVALVKLGRPRETLRTEFLGRATALGVRDDIVLLDALPPEALPRLYAACDVFLQPSLYEGFGIPPLEALASGTPVVASRIASHEEVLGDAALYADPTSVEEFAEAVIGLLGSPSRSAALAGKGVARAAVFPWSATVEGYLRVYEEVAAGGPR